MENGPVSQDVDMCLSDKDKGHFLTMGKHELFPPQVSLYSVFPRCPLESVGRVVPRVRYGWSSLIFLDIDIDLIFYL